MDNDLTLEIPLITLDLEDGNQVTCQVIAFFSAGEHEYIALYPEKEVDDGEVIIYRYEEDEDGSPILSNVETDEEFKIVSEAFEKLQDEWEEDE